MPESAVTPAGVRDGEPDALRGLVARRGPAVLAYCAAVCDPAVAPRAAAEAFARFRGAVAAAVEPGALAPEPLLLGATRHAAASVARTAPTPPAGLRRLMADRGANETCAVVPTLLAAQVDGMLSPDDQDRLRRHLDRHPACREVEAAFHAAEAQYSTPPDRPIPPAVERLILTAMVAAAPLAPGVDASSVLVSGQTEEEDAIAAAQETQDWAAADVAAALAAADADADAGAWDPEPDVVDSAPADVPLLDVDRPADEGDDEEAQDDPEVAAAPAEQTTTLFPAVAVPDEPAPSPLDVPPPHPDAATVADPADYEDDEDDDLAYDEDFEDDTDREPVTEVHASVDGAAAAVAADRSLRDRLHLPDEQDHGTFFRFILPGAAIVVALLIAALVAGVFDGDDPDPAPAGAAPAAQTVAPASAVAEPDALAAPEPERPAATTRTATTPKRPRPAGRTTTTDADAVAPAPVTAADADAQAPTPSPDPVAPRRSTPRRRAADEAAERTDAAPSLPGATPSPSTTPADPADEPVFTPGESPPAP